MMIYIERELTEDINSDLIIDDFFSLNIEGCNFNNEFIFTFTLILCTFKFIF